MLSTSFTGSTATQAQIRTFEQQIQPYFESKANGTLATAANLYSPSQADLFMIARYWKQLSIDFKSLYLRALQIPATLNRLYISLSGNFEIYYTISGYDSIDITDTFGFSTSNGRNKLSGPNGIPDYVRPCCLGNGQCMVNGNKPFCI